MTLDDLRGYRTTTREMLDSGQEPFLMIGIADSRLIEVANHICVCHRSLSEDRAILRLGFWPDRKRLNAKIEQTCLILNEMLEIQQELLDVKASALHKAAVRFYDLELTVRGYADEC